MPGISWKTNIRPPGKMCARRWSGFCCRVRRKMPTGWPWLVDRIDAQGVAIFRRAVQELGEGAESCSLAWAAGAAARVSVGLFAALAANSLPPHQEAPTTDRPQT